MKRASFSALAAQNEYVPYAWLVERGASGTSKVDPATITQHVDAPAPHVAWHFLRSLNKNPPQELTLDLVKAMSAVRAPMTGIAVRQLAKQHHGSDNNKNNSKAGRVGKSLSVSLLTVPQRLALIEEFLRYSLNQDAFEHINVVIRHHLQELDGPAMTHLWQMIAANELVCPAKMCEWLDLMPPRGWTLSADTAVLIMIRGQRVMPAPLALRILDMYISTNTTAEHMELLKTRNGRARVPPLSPLPFYTFVLAARNAMTTFVNPSPVPGAPPRIPGHVLSWKIVWRRFQTLNLRVPSWHVGSTRKQVQDACHGLLELIVLKAPPAMTISLVQRMVNAGGFNDAIDAAVQIMKRLPSHLDREAAATAMVRLYRLLIGLKFHSAEHNYQAEIFTVANALIRMQLFDCVVNLYDLLFEENVAESTEEFKQSVISVFADIVCPSCSKVLKNKNVHARRVCSSCFCTIPPKHTTQRPSFEPKVEALQASKQRRAGQMRAAVQEFRQHALRHSSDASLSKLRKAVLEEPIVPAVEINARGHREVLSLPPQQLDAKDIRAVLRRESVASRRQEIEMRQSALVQDAKSEEARPAPSDVRARIPSEITFPHINLVDILSDTPATAPPAAAAAPEDNVTKQPTPDGTDGDIADKSPTPAPFTVDLTLPTSRSKGASTAPVPWKPLPWTCVWCEEENPKDVKLACYACGAEAGPAAGWRRQSSADPLKDLLHRLEHVKESPQAAVSATYALMLYRKKFLLHATKDQLRELNTLVNELAARRERVMAAYVYFHIIPGSVRDRTCLPNLMTLFGTSTAANLKRVEKADAEVLGTIVLGHDTCSVCYDQTHTWKSCPIVTRRFPEVSSRRETQKSPMSLDTFRQSLNTGMFSLADRSQRESVPQKPKLRSPTVTAKELVVTFERTVKNGNLRDALSNFLVLPNRQLYAEEGHKVIHDLLFRLLDVGSKMNVRQAAYLLSIMPRHLRQNEAYQRVSECVGVMDPLEVKRLISDRKVGDAAASHPHYSQVVGACCVCLVGEHASDMCPNMLDWYAKEKNSSSPNAPKTSRLHAEKAAMSFATSGPERLQAFFKFLLQSASDINVRAPKTAGHIPLAINVCIEELVRTDCLPQALNLLVAIARPHVADSTVASVMRALKHSEMDIEYVTHIRDELPMEYVVPSNYCLVCFSPGHTLFDCPTVSFMSPDMRVKATVQRLIMLGQRSAIAAAADYVFALSLRNKHSLSLMQREVSQELEKLVGILVRTKDRARAVRVLELLPQCNDDTAVMLWTSLGLDQQTMREVMRRGHHHHRHGDDLFRQLMHKGVCPYCAVNENHSTRCPTLDGYIEMGRNLLAIFRTGVLEEDKVGGAHRDRLHALCLKYRDHLPYHVPTIQKVTNALCAFYAISGDTYRAMEQLKAVPPQYRERYTYEHVLRAYGVSHDAEVEFLKDHRPSTDTEFARRHPEAEKDIVAVLGGTVCESCWEVGHVAAACPRPRQRIDAVQIFVPAKLRAEIASLQRDFEIKLGMGVGTNHELFRSRSAAAAAAAQN